MSDTQYDFDVIINNLTNGNKSDYRRAIAEMDTINVVFFIEYALTLGYTMEEINVVNAIVVWKNRTI